VAPQQFQSSSSSNSTSNALKTGVGPGFDPHGALVMRLDSIHEPTAAELSQPEQGGGEHREGYVARQAIDEWLASRRREAKIKNNLDQFFRD